MRLWNPEQILASVTIIVSLRYFALFFTRVILDLHPYIGESARCLRVARTFSPLHHLVNVLYGHLFLLLIVQKIRVLVFVATVYYTQECVSILSKDFDYPSELLNSLDCNCVFVFTCLHITADHSKKDRAVYMSW